MDFYDDENEMNMDLDDLSFDGQYNEFFDDGLFGFPSMSTIPLSDEVSFNQPQQFFKNEQHHSIKEDPQIQYSMNHYLKPQIKEEHDYAYVPQPISISNYKQPPPPKPIQSNDIDIIIESQPPVEVRTRTPSEIRTFGVTCKVLGSWRQMGATLMNVSLWYAQTEQFSAGPVGKDILGGTKTTPILPDGTVTFDNLSVSESSTKHKEREFSLQLVLLRNDGHELFIKKTRPFYAYSHKKVLQRRGSVKLRTLSKSWGRISGREMMHVIGSPFIQGPALALIIRTPFGDLNAKPLEYYSDSVLFFELPACPVDPSIKNEIKAQVILTNDGRTYSNSLDFTYIPDDQLK